MDPPQKEIIPALHAKKYSNANGFDIPSSRGSKKEKKLKSRNSEK